ncbi:uncharacterized protein LOC135224540 isoform X2 [Macrobrachium nipponense]|uniref:uncharacterized protein LOC135224540 isoform X2 n=1 Tax=Macrobrachium nipponense TaxID=159736 RepID=UPI0030C7D3C0
MANETRMKCSQETTTRIGHRRDKDLAVFQDWNHGTLLCANCSQHHHTRFKEYPFYTHNTKLKMLQGRTGLVILLKHEVLHWNLFDLVCCPYYWVSAEMLQM